MRPDATVHATALVLGIAGGPRGVLLTGPSGAGKSSLALALIEAAHREGRFAALVADDRTVLEAVHGALLASAPEPLAGLAERRGLGLAAVDHLHEARIHLHAHLDDVTERMPEPTTSTFEGVDVPRIDLPSANGPHHAAALPLLLAALRSRT